MKIAFSHKEHDDYDISRPGGAAYVNMQIGRWLKQKFGHEVKFFYNGNFEIDEYGNEHLPIGTFFEYRDNYFDAVIGSCIIWPVLEKKCTRKIVLMHDRINKNDKFKFTDKEVVNDKDIIVVCLSNTHKKTIENIGCKNPIVVIKNGYDENCYPRNISRPQDRYKLIYAAATTESKGLDLVLQSFFILKEKFPQLSLTICGDAKLHGGNKENVLNMFENDIKKYSDSIDVKGFVKRKDLYELYRSSGVFVAPTRLDLVESCPLGAIESQVCGLPVVASNNGAFPELVANGFTGNIMENYNMVSLINSVFNIIDDEHIWKTYVKNCVGSMMNDFHSWEEVAAQYNELLENGCTWENL